LSLVYGISDAKLKRTYSQSLIEELLFKRPYCRALTLELLSNSGLLRETEFDLARLARECLKNLSGEDLRLMHIQDDGRMAEWETRYTAAG
jgi:hypothetical protein